MLTERQKLSLKHLKDIGITEPMDIIQYCVRNLSRPNMRNHKKHPEQRVSGRRHSKKHYQGIIDYLAQKRDKQPS
jgi:hypothetical protein